MSMSHMYDVSPNTPMLMPQIYDVSPINELCHEIKNITNIWCVTKHADVNVRDVSPNTLLSSQEGLIIPNTRTN